MDIITRGKRIEIDVAKIMRTIDSALHEEITNKTGIIITHDTIVAAIAKTIHEHNQEELRFWYEVEQEERRLGKENKKISDKIKSGRVVSDTNSLRNKVKYHLMGYVCVESNVYKSEEGEENE